MDEPAPTPDGRAAPAGGSHQFWGTHGGAELDLLVTVGSRRVGIEIKRTTQPRMTPSIRSALDDLDRIVVVHAGDHSFQLAPNVDAVPAHHLLSEGFT